MTHRPPRTFRSLFRLLLLVPAGVLFMQTPGLQAYDPSSSYGEVADHLARWDIQAARESLDELPEGEEEVKVWLQGMVSFYEGEYGEAMRLFSSLPQGKRAVGDVGEMTLLARRTLELSEGLSRRESEHFILSLNDRRDWVLAGPALKTLEAAYVSLGEWLGHHPEEKIRVEIIPSAADFEKVSGLTRSEIETSGAVGICRFNKIMLLSPRLLLQGYRWRDSLTHEYAHFLLVHLTANNAPIWLQEGVARFAETLWRSPPALRLQPAEESLLAAALRDGTLVAFEEMDPSLVRLPSMHHVRLAFAECVAAVVYLMEEWPDGGLRRVFRAFAAGGAGSGSDEALREALGTGMIQFERQWRVHLQSQGLTEIPGMRVPDLKVREAGGGKETEEWEMERWQPLEARNHLKLGDMLRRRGKARAGMQEYLRALKTAPSSPFVLNKVGRALQELSRSGEAEEYFRRAAALHPDYAATYVNLAGLLAGEGRHAEAAGMFRESIDINPFNPFAWKGLAFALAEGEGEVREEAWKSAETAYRLNPSDRELGRLLGRE